MHFNPLMLALVACLAAFGINPAFACQMPHPPDYEEVLIADAVFVGRMVAHEEVGIEAIRPKSLLTYRIIGSLKGDLSGTVQVMVNGLSSEGAASIGQRPQILSVWSGASSELTRERQARGLYYQYLHPCSGLSNISGTPRNIEVVKKWLTEGRVVSSEISSDTLTVVTEPAHEDQRTRAQFEFEYIWIAMAVAAALGATGFALRATARRS
jgi:hypothetical protein